MSSKYLIDKSSSNSMNAKKRRLERRKELKDKMEERQKLIEELGASPPATRESMWGRFYSSSKEEDWSYFDGAGWVYKDESELFYENYAKCAVTNKWGRTRDMASIPSRSADGSHDEYRTMMRAEAEKLGYAKCEYSGNWFKKEDMMFVWSNITEKFNIHSQYESVYRKCDFSGKLIDPSNALAIRKSEKYNVVARWFYDHENFERCYDCKNFFEAKMAPSRSEFAVYLCEECFEVRSLGNLIHPHNYSEYPKPIHSKRKVWRVRGGEPKKDEHGFNFFIGKRVDEQVDNPAIRLFGWEAETEISKKSASKAGLNRNRLAHQVISVLGKDYVIIKEDGTLTANEHYSKRTGYSGFEIVSAPADLEAHRARIPNLLKLDGFDGKRTGHFRAWDEYDTCGFHVHVSRDSLAPLQIGRMLYLINHKKNAKFIHKVAGRGSDRFCRYIPKEPGDKTHPAADVLYPSERVISKEEVDNARNRSRRVALNLCNSKTVEFRIFRGTMHPRHILRNLEFCDAVCDYCYPGNFSLRDMENMDVFISFINGNRKRWPLFAEWLVNQKIIEMKKLGEKAQIDKLTINPDNAAEADREAPSGGESESGGGFTFTQTKAQTKANSIVSKLKDNEIEEIFSSLNSEVKKSAKAKVSTWDKFNSPSF